MSDALSAAERAADRAERLLRRNGFACRELLDPEVDGPWRASYDVLTRMEWAGSVKRGYFVEGITGSQFALPGVHMGGAGEGQVHWLALLDPANVWSRVDIKWSTSTGEYARVPRVRGSWLAILNGRPVLAATTWGEHLIPLPAGDAEHAVVLRRVAELLGRLPHDERPNLLIRTWGEHPIIGSPAEAVLLEQGFTRDMQGLRLYRSFAGAGQSREPPAQP